MSKAQRTKKFGCWLHVRAGIAGLCLAILFSPSLTLGLSGASGANKLPEATPTAVAPVLGPTGAIPASLPKQDLALSILSRAPAPLTEVDRADGRPEASKEPTNQEAAEREPVRYAALDVAPGMGPAIHAPRGGGSAKGQSRDSGRGPNIFGSLAIAAPNVPLARVARSAFAIVGGRSDGARCEPVAALDCPIEASDPWASLLSHAQRLSAIEQIDWINQQVNRRVKYTPDYVSHLLPDHWSPAHDTMLRQTGDCEDYAILKMWLLQQLGYPAEDMFVVVVQSPSLAAQHAVLAVRAAGSLLVLDNLSGQLRRDHDIDGYSPIFSVNAHGLWIHGFPAAKEVASLFGTRTRND